MYKAADRFTSGIPDLLLCIQGKFNAIELKVGSNKPTRIQEFVMREIRKAGGRVSVCRSVEDVKCLIEEGGESDA